MDTLISPIKVKNEYKLISNLLSNKTTLAVSMIIVLLVFNIAFYSYRINELLIIKRNFESHISKIVYSENTNSYTFKRTNSMFFKKCKNDYNDYCINGICRYIVDLSEVVCLCNRGYTGIRCEEYTI
ncbi:EGF-like protein [Canarypox virus]|uniref:CNPV285 EGF-like protein n=1 Tax=Canarypox virus TaxID=44088 RepID=Q6VZ62_CNPV|nr:EGF-like protein [Canarypox virus]AAR83631.1 CNPV285 EGF-like protein [Canarypox virus]AWD84761.1 EGF-like protein [Canarypox virus]